MPVIFESTQLLGIIVRACVLSCTAAQYYRHLLPLLSQSRVPSSGNEQHDVCLYDVCIYDVYCMMFMIHRHILENQSGFSDF